MSAESVLLVGRETRTAEDVLTTHADRIRERGLVDSVAVATYEHEPVRELKSQLEAHDSDRVYAVPMCAAHTYETTDGVPRALSYLSGEVRYCEPVGASPAVTDVIEARGAERVAPASDVSLVVVAFGSSSKPHQRETAEYHAARLREHADYGEVVPCYLLQNPAVECVRYNVSNDSAVAVPLFVSRSAATEERIPDALELDRGGMAYADPFGEHPRVTDAIAAAVERQRALTTDDARSATTADAHLAGTQRPVATDGDGRSDD